MNLSELRTVVISRDRQCVAALLDRSHLCHDRWGFHHDATDLDKLTLEHVHEWGKRFDDPLHCVAMCYNGNVEQHWSSANNALANTFLAGVRIGQGLSSVTMMPGQAPYSEAELHDLYIAVGEAADSDPGEAGEPHPSSGSPGGQGQEV